MYAKDDLRSTMKPATDAKAVGATFPASYGKFYESPPQDDIPGGGKTWYWRGQNLVIAFTRVSPGDKLKRKNVDEWAILVSDKNVAFDIEAGGERASVKAPSFVVVPPGDSEITVTSGGEFYRLITTRSADLVAKCPNKALYADQHDPNIPPFQDWPAPPAGYKLRVYDGSVPSTPGRFGRLYRCSTIMVNFGSGRPEPRDPHKMSPHHHDDFEQYSLCLAGEYVHHIRWPWTTDMDHWRPDDHEFCGAPSVAVIPPPSIHTSQAMIAFSHLVDVFSPPRRDFSSKPGWVLNAADYPEPADLVMSNAPLKE